ncbi:sugar transferase [Ornithinimicrobium cryptoxanthini]|uniref:Sugar transferase n=1 Tax=Ornithinimicrobium cryptoxanthini TaxID=2934161 RepID=A0ABY4YH36_9MICO|nr:sugar transferase [Ornithinimicrobium cryptoxanthini]USQ76091.1 sugar transferase [Ornithinimicrobium cryptoxanthini]
MSYRAKRAVDLALAIPALLATAPIQLVAAAAIRVTMGPPVLFRQRRPGLGGTPFTMLKLRTMRSIDVRSGRVDDASRLTGLGRLLRATSIDELPAFLNVIRGDMSLVGPRPLLMHYLDLYTPEQARRHEVRPGVTGLAQVSGRNALTWEDKFAKDVEYVDKHSLRLDLSILLITLGKVLQRDGISADGDVTMPEFLGSQRA